MQLVGQVIADMGVFLLVHIVRSSDGTRYIFIIAR